MRITLARSLLIVTILAISAAFFGFSTVRKQFAGLSQSSSVAATVLEVRRYRRSKKPRLWVRFEFVTSAGDAVRSARAVYAARWDAVQAGDRITVKYSPRNPQRNRIAALEPPAQGAPATRPQATGSKSGWKGVSLLGAIALLAALAVIWRLMAPLVRVLTSAFPDQTAGSRPAERPVPAAGPWARTRGRIMRRKRNGAGSRREAYRRNAPGRTKKDRWGRSPAKSKVKVRAGWF